MLDFIVMIYIILNSFNIINPMIKIDIQLLSTDNDFKTTLTSIYKKILEENKNQKLAIESLSHLIDKEVIIIEESVDIRNVIDTIISNRNIKWINNSVHCDKILKFYVDATKEGIEAKLIESTKTAEDSVINDFWHFVTQYGDPRMLIPFYKIAIQDDSTVYTDEYKFITDNIDHVAISDDRLCKIMVANLLEASPVKFKKELYNKYLLPSLTTDSGYNALVARMNLVIECNLKLLNTTKDRCDEELLNLFIKNIIIESNIENKKILPSLELLIDKCHIDYAFLTIQLINNISHISLSRAKTILKSILEKDGEALNSKGKTKGMLTYVINHLHSFFMHAIPASSKAETTEQEKIQKFVECVLTRHKDKANLQITLKNNIESTDILGACIFYKQYDLFKLFVQSGCDISHSAISILHRINISKEKNLLHDVFLKKDMNLKDFNNAMQNIENGVTYRVEFTENEKLLFYKAYMEGILMRYEDAAQYPEDTVDPMYLSEKLLKNTKLFFLPGAQQSDGNILDLVSEVIAYIPDEDYIEQDVKSDSDILTSMLEQQRQQGCISEQQEKLILRNMSYFEQYCQRNLKGGIDKIFTNTAKALHTTMQFLKTKVLNLQPDENSLDKHLAKECYNDYVFGLHKCLFANNIYFKISQKCKRFVEETKGLLGKLQNKIGSMYITGSKSKGEDCIKAYKTKSFKASKPSTKEVLYKLKIKGEDKCLVSKTHYKHEETMVILFDATETHSNNSINENFHSHESSHTELAGLLEDIGLA